MTKELNFYTRPFELDGNRVYDSNDNFMFWFDFSGNDLERLRVLQSLNSIEKDPLARLELTIAEDPIVILHEKTPFITIRGWGNLTGGDGHGFPDEKAMKIQDDLRDWIIQKLS